jgi:hypothetical protein
MELLSEEIMGRLKSFTPSRPPVFPPVFSATSTPVPSQSRSVCAISTVNFTELP